MAPCECQVFREPGWIPRPEQDSASWLSSFLSELEIAAGEDVEVQEFADYPITKNGIQDAVSLYDVYLSLRKDVSGLKRANKDLLQGQLNAATSTRLRIRSFFVHIIRRIDQIKAFENTASQQGQNLLVQSWKLFKGIVMQLGYLFGNSKVIGADSFGIYSRSINDALSHIHLESLLLAAIAAIQIEKNFPEYSPELLNHLLYSESSLQTSPGLAVHMINMVWRHFTGVALAQFLQTQNSNWFHYLDSRPFPCDCYLQTLWTVHHLAAGNVSSHFYVSFLDQARKITEEFTNTAAKADLQFLCSDVLPPITKVSTDVPGFLLWLLCHTLPHHTGFLKPLEPIVRGSDFGKMFSACIVQPIITTFDHSWSEPKARCYMTSIRRIQSAIGPQPEIVTNLFELFFRHINDSFALEPASIHSLAILYEDGFCWAKKWTDIRQEDDHGSQTDTSFEVFLQILLTTLSTHPESWKRMKSRLLSKLHARFFESLSVTGWSHTFDLVMVLIGRTNDMTDFTSYFSDVILDSNWSSKALINKTLVIWRGFVALIATLRLHNMDCINLVKKLATEFDHLCKYLKNVRFDPSLANSLWTIVNVYFDAMENLIGDQTDTVGIVAALLTSGFNDLFQAPVDDTKLRKLFAVTENVIQQYVTKHPQWKTDLQGVTGRHHQSFLNSVFSNVLPSAKRLAGNRNGNFAENVSSVAVQCSIFSVTHNHSGNVADSPTSLFSLFGLSDETNPQVTCMFLSQILQLPEVIENVRKDEFVESRLVHSWIRCVVELGENHDAVSELSKQITKLRELDVFQLQGCDTVLLFHNFCKNCGHYLDKCTTYDAKMSFQRKFQIYFADLSKFVGNALRNSTSFDRVDSVIKVPGWIIKYCSGCLHVKAKLNNNLRQLVEAVLFGPDNPEVFRSLQKRFPLYYIGLCKLEAEGDNQLKDILSAIIRSYLIKFALISLEPHPLLSAVREVSYFNPANCAFVVNVICNSFLAHVPVPQNAAIAVSFLLKLIATVPSSAFTSSIESLFSNSLDACLQLNSLVQHEAHLLFAKTVKICSEKCADTLRNSLALIFREKCLLHVQTQPKNIFSVLDVVSNSYPDLMRDILPFLTQVFSGHCSNYASYQTPVAKQFYVNLLGKLGDVGQKELRKLTPLKS